jgi:hypothetical protein
MHRDKLCRGHPCRSRWRGVPFGRLVTKCSLGQLISLVNIGHYLAYPAMRDSVMVPCTPLAGTRAVQEAHAPRARLQPCIHGRGPTAGRGTALLDLEGDEHAQKPVPDTLSRALRLPHLSVVPQRECIEGTIRGDGKIQVGAVHDYLGGTGGYIVDTLVEGASFDEDPIVLSGVCGEELRCSKKDLVCLEELLRSTLIKGRSLAAVANGLGDVPDQPTEVDNGVYDYCEPMAGGWGT